MKDILIANNNLIEGEGIKTILQSRIRNRIVGVVGSLEQLESFCNKTIPDIVIIDYSSNEFGT